MRCATRDVALGLSLTGQARYCRRMQFDEETTLAKTLYNRCWELLETTARTPDQDVELLTSAFAARHHWLTVGGPEQFVVSDWMVARAAGDVGATELALLFARRANGAAEVLDGPEWLSASTAEGVARACAQAGDVDEATRWVRVAAQRIELITDDEDRDLIADQLRSLRVE